jgi:N-acetylmuramoyl-L-alanine amidase
MNLIQSLKNNYKIKQSLFSLLFLQLFCFSSVLNSQEKIFTVVLDAGHGGKDPGKVEGRYIEKDIALKIALNVGGALKKRSDIKVIYTRIKDVSVDLGDRPKIANNADADLFVSIHCNAHHSQASGTETYVLGVANTDRNFAVAKAENEVILLEENHEKKYKGFNPNSPESIIGLSLIQEEHVDNSILLASLVEKNFVGAYKRKSRGVKQASLWVIHQTSMPSVLIETGFITNKKEGKYLYSKKGQQESANAISKAIIDYLKNIQLNQIHEMAILVDNNKSERRLKKQPYFKIQIASGKSKIKTASYNFKGLRGVNRVLVGTYYKYYLGNTESYKEAKSLLEKAKKAGYKSSFMAAFIDNERIPLAEALK